MAPNSRPRATARARKAGRAGAALASAAAPAAARKHLRRMAYPFCFRNGLWRAVVEESKRFFFEKKNQKTFALLG
jgi:hypothetical protein